MAFLHFHHTAGGGQVDFSGPNVRRSVLAVAAPMLVAQILNLLYNIVDRIYIGKIPGHGTLALAGLGVNGVFLAEPISNLIGGLACYITMRCTVMPELSAMERATSTR